MAKLSALNVIARTSVMQYADSDKAISEIAEELNIETVMEGSVRYADDRVLVTAQLIDPETNAHLWSDSYNREFEDVFGIQADIAMNVANALAVEFSLEERRAIDTPPTDSTDAYKAFLRARNAAFEQNTNSARLALAYLDEAISLDPEFALAYSAKADAYANLLISSFGVNAADSIGRAEVERISRASAEKAIALDPNQWLAREALGRSHELNWRWSEALHEYEESDRLKPRLQLRTNVIWYLMTGNLEEGTRLAREQVARDPLVAQSYWVLGLMHAYSGNADAAVVSVREAVTLAPNSALMHLWLAHAEGMRGNAAEALDELDIAEQLPGADVSSVTIANLAYANAWNGRPNDAARLHAELAERAPDRRLDAGNWALAHFAVGDEQAAQASLETVIDKIANEEPDAGYISLALIKANIYSDPVLNKPAFQRLRSQIQGH